MSVSSQIWHTWLWAHPRQVGVLLCTLLYRTVWSTISASRSVWPDSLRPHRPQPTRLHCPWDFSSKDTGVHCHFLLQGIFATKGLNPGVLSCRQILYQLSYKGSWRSTILQYFYFKPTMSERKRKCSGNIDGTTILFLKVCLFVQLYLNFQHMVCSFPGSSCHGGSLDKNTGVGCHALSRYWNI